MMRKEWKKRWNATGTFMAACLLALTALVPAAPAAAKDVKVKPTVTSDSATSKIRVSSVKYDLDVDEDDYDQDENVEIKFKTYVSYRKGFTVSATNEDGKKLEVQLDGRDKDDCDLYIGNLSKGHTYTVTLDGIGLRRSATYGTLKVSFKIPASASKPSTGNKVKVRVKDVDYDEDDQELDIEFASKVKFRKNAEISIKDTSGKNIPAEIIDWDSDECTVSVDLTEGKKYSFVINGICKRGQSSYGKLSGSFTVEYDD